MPFKNPAPSGAPRSRTWIEQDLARLDHSQLATDFSDYCADRLAARYGITSRQLRRYFKEWFGRSPKEWLLEKRMNFAQNMLKSGEPVKTVAIQLGFKHASHFCTLFKRTHGVSPSAYQDQIISGAGDTGPRILVGCHSVGLESSHKAWSNSTRSPDSLQSRAGLK